MPNAVPVLDPPTQYAQDVVSGKEIAGPLVRLACQRHLDDLIEGPKRGLKWEWTLADGDAPRGTGKYVADFFENELLLTADKPFILEPPLMFIVGSLFGWKGPDGYRRFRVGYVEIGKGNAKTSLGGGLGLYMMIADGEPRADCFTAAVDKDQAKIPFRDAVSFVNLNPRLDEVLKRSGANGSEWNLAYLKTQSYFRPTSSENKGRGKSGFRPHFVLLDEIHEHPTAAMVDLAIANLKTRSQPMVLMITNSGVVDPGSVCYQHHEHAERMLDGRDQNNDSQFYYVCSLDKGDAWTDPAVRKKANPMLGIIPGMERYLDECVAGAVGMPSKQSFVRRMNFCEWVDSADPFVEPSVWKENGGTLDLHRLRGRKCWGGLDLSGKNDLTALVLVFEPHDDDAQPVLSFFWTPKDTIRQREEQDRAPYQRWVREGYLTACDGKTINYAFVAQKIGELAAIYDIEFIAFDPYRIEDLERELSSLGVNVALKEHGQTFRHMNPALESLEDALLDRRIRHGDNPILGWCVSNVRVLQDQAGNRKFDKLKATGRIDGAQALAMAEHMAAGMGREEVVHYAGRSSLA